jgi:putative FmdB family regulatory protein
MPYYEYVCRECGERFSKKRSFAEASHTAACPACASHHTQKRLHAVAVIGTTSGRDSIPLPMSHGGGCGCGGHCSCQN